MSNESYRNTVSEIQSRCTCFQIARDVCGLTIYEEELGYYCKSFLPGDDEKIYMIDKYWYSFTRQKYGDAISLVAYCLFEGNQYESIKYLANYFDIHLSENIEFNRHSLQLKKIQEQVTCFHNGLLGNKRVLDLIQSRNITIETVTRTKLGFRDAYYSVEQNRWIPARLIIPMIQDNEVSYYTGSLFDEEASSKDTNYLKPILDGFMGNDIYGLETLSSKYDFVVVCEDIFDYLSFYQEGYPVLSNFDKNWSRHKQIKHLKVFINHFLEKHKNGYVILIFDNDDSEKGFTQTIAEYLFKNAIPFKVAFPPSVKDAYGNDVLRENGKPLTKSVSEFYCANGDLKSLVLNAEDGLMYLCKQFNDKNKFSNFLYHRRWCLSKMRRENLLITIKHVDEKEDLFGFGNGKSTERNEWFRLVKREILSAPTEYEVTNEILHKYDIVHTNGIGWLIYQNGYWDHVDKEDIQKIIKEELKSCATGRNLTNIMTMIKATVHKDNLELNKQSLINFSNGTLELETGIFRSPRKEDYQDYRFNYPYRKDAESLLWSRYLSSTFDDEKKALLLQEFCGYCLSSDTKMEKALFLLGDGSNGKSVFLDILNSIFGKAEDNRSSLISCVGLDAMSNDFRVIGLKGKKINVVFESQGKKRLSADEFKTIISGEVLGGCLKYEQYKEFIPTCKHIFACNELPHFNDFSDAIERRLLIVYFPYKFVSHPEKANEKQIDLNLKALAKNKDDLSGIFNWMYEGYKKYKSFGSSSEFTQPDDMLGYIASYKSENDNLISFIEQFGMKRRDYEKGIDVPIEFISTEELYRRYVMYCEDGHFNFTIDRKIFDRRVAVLIEKYRPDLIKTRENNTTRGYRTKSTIDPEDIYPDLPF